MGTPPRKRCPDKCQICQMEMSGEHEFYDFRTFIGSWADGCVSCWYAHGTGLGTGKGQKYERQDDGTFLQTAGGMFTRGG
jgi:hypothetical protein